MAQASPFTVGTEYRRRDLHAEHGGQRQGGISTPANSKMVLLFTGEQGNTYGYRDEFTGDGVFHYTGEGQTGDMQMVRGNDAIRHHRANNRNLYLFEYVQAGIVRYVGEGEYLGHHFVPRPDRDVAIRSAIVFELEIGVDQGTPVAGNRLPIKPPDNLWSQPLDVLRKLAMQHATGAASAKVRRQNVYARSVVVRAYVLRRANGRCEGCQQPAPFLTKLNRPYLEPHHVNRRADGGPDAPDAVIALCPTCHRRVHHAKDGAAYNATLKKALKVIEP